MSRERDTIERLKADILNQLKWEKQSTFASLSHIEGFNGDYDLALRPGLILWSGMSEEAIEAMRELHRERKFHSSFATIFDYLYDGGFLNLPIANSVRPYKRPRWLITSVNLGWPDELSRETCRPIKAANRKSTHPT